MTRTIPTKNHIEALSKMNFTLILVSCACVFSYLILLGLTATNVVSARTLSKSVEEKKTELATVELDYMSSENIMALENASNADFTAAKNIAYVTPGDTNPLDTVAFAKAVK